MRVHARRFPLSLLGGYTRCKRNDDDRYLIKFLFRHKAQVQAGTLKAGPRVYTVAIALRCRTVQFASVQTPP